MSAPCVLHGLRLHRALEVPTDLVIAAHERIAIVGPNGAGKSTLLRALVGAEPIQAGKILLGGTTLHSLTPTARARRVALVTPSPRAVPGLRLREFVALGRLPHGDADIASRIIAEALDELALASLAERWMETLSNGELARAQLARSLVQSTPLLLLDEPTAHLDPKHRLAVLDSLERRSGTGLAVVCVLHDLDHAVAWATRVAILHAGRLDLRDPADAALPEHLGRVFDIGIERRTDGSLHATSRVVSRSSTSDIR